MANNFLKIILSTVLILSSFNIHFAQTGNISGVAMDTNDQIALIGANVYLKNAPSTGDVTDIDGGFNLRNVPIGEQVISISYLSYATLDKTINVVEGDNEMGELFLSPVSVKGAEVLITAQAIGQTKAINQQLNADAIGNFISAEKIKELPDVNAAEAISRLPGVAINRNGGEGSKVVVRGLDPKFTAISINGVRLPSTSGTDRSVDLSLISPELLSGIELFKSPTPDMDGDALGGSINLTILRAPKDRKITVKGLGGYNFLGETLNDYKTTISFSQRVLNNKLGIIATGNAERFNRSGETIVQGWNDNLAVVLDTLLDIFDQEATNQQFIKGQESRKRYNGSLGLDYKIGKNSEFNILGIYSRTSRERYNHTERYDVQNNRVSFRPNLIDNSIELFSGSITGRHGLGFVTIDWGASQSKVIGETPQDYEPQFINDQAPFQPEVFDKRKQPQNFFDFLDIDPSANYLLQAESSSSSNSETINSAFVNFDVPLFKTASNKLNFKFGSKIVSTKKDRTFFQENVKLYYLTPNSAFNDFAMEGKELIGATGVDPTGGFYLSLDNFASDGTLSFTRENGEKVDLLTSFDLDKVRRFQSLFADDLVENRYRAVDNYDLQENLYAFYGMFKLNFGSKITLIPGARYEYNKNTYNGIFADLSGDFGESGTPRPQTADKDYGIFMPHLHLKYKPLEWLDLRASYSTTLARPDYDYVVPFTSVNRSSDLIIREGNPDLNPSVSTNYDLYATAYSGKYGLLSAGAFIKQIDNAFYPFIVGLNNDSLAVAYGFPEVGFVGGELTTYTNSPKSTVKGFEIDLQSNLGFLPKPFDGLILNINYSRLFSSTTVNSFFEETTLKGTFPFIFAVTELFPFQREVDLIGQAKHIFNASLGYDYKGFSMRASSSYQGSKLSGYSSSADKDRFNNEFWRFDMVFKQKFGYNFSVFLNLNNISDQRDINFFRSEEFVTSISRFGATTTIGAEYIFR